MSYVPGHLELLSRSATIDGWPEGVDEAGKTFAIERVKAGLEKYGELSLDLAYSCIYKGNIDDTPVPESLKGVVWDWLHAVTYRSLLAAQAETVFIARRPPSAGVNAFQKSWYRVPLSKATIKALETAMQVTVGATRIRIGKLLDSVNKVA